jgi:hypothetical protein
LGTAGNEAGKTFATIAAFTMGEDMRLTARPKREKITNGKLLTIASKPVI